MVSPQPGQEPAGLPKEIDLQLVAVGDIENLRPNKFAWRDSDCAPNVVGMTTYGCLLGANRSMRSRALSAAVLSSDLSESEPMLGLQQLNGAQEQPVM
jgi:hypothetical protein